MLEDVKKQKSRIGEILLDYGLITEDQLSRALDRQVQSGRRLGSMLEEMGYLDDDSLLSVLSSQYDVPFVNLFEIQVPPEVLNLLTYDQIRSYKVLPFKKAANAVYLAMVDPGDTNALLKAEAAIGTSVKPFVVPYYQMDKALSSFEKDGYGKVLFEGSRLREEKILVEPKIPGIYTLLKLLVNFNATSLHLTAGAPPSMRIDNDLKRLSMPLITSAQMKDITSEILGKEQAEEFEKEKELDFVLSLPDTGRFRIGIYKQRNSITLSARLIFENIPTVAGLNLPDWITEYALKAHGLILIAGLPGQGKTATLSALVDVINSQRKCNIVTVEDPIEYLHRHNMSNVNQREVGIDTDSFPAGLRNILKQDPDVIVVGELREPESIALALNAAESGHLVISTIHSLNTSTAIEKILNIFPDHQLPRIRTQLADTLMLLFSQKLVPKRDGAGRLPACEKLTNSPRISNLIREGKTANIRSLMQTLADDVSALDQSVARMCLKGTISFEDGLKYSDNPAYYQELVRTGRV